MDHVDRERARSLRFVQIVFAVLALVSIVAGLAVAYSSEWLGLPEASSGAIAIAFICVGIMNTALLFVWERIFHDASF
ncbi:MAG TPA: hypothetical protein PKD49_06735 [Hyphomicrobium sp.]|nr:hypothetical protein [Hyphomicrobium sp.]